MQELGGEAGWAEEGKEAATHTVRRGLLCWCPGWVGGRMDRQIDRQMDGCILAPSPLLPSTQQGSLLSPLGQVGKVRQAPGQRKCSDSPLLGGLCPWG